MQSGLRNGADRISEAHDQGLAGLRYREQRKEGDEDRDQCEERDDAAGIEVHPPSTDGGGSEFGFVSPEPIECRHLFRFRHSRLHVLTRPAVCLSGRNSRTRTGVADTNGCVGIDVERRRNALDNVLGDYHRASHRTDAKAEIPTR
jgi:hypothetical protein